MNVGGQVKPAPLVRRAHERVLAREVGDRARRRDANKNWLLNLDRISMTA